MERCASVLRFSVRGRPVAKGRPRALPFLSGSAFDPAAAVRMITPRETAAAERQIAEEFRQRFPGHRPWVGPIMLQFTAVFAIPRGFAGKQREAALQGQLYHTAKPDKDNIEKLLCDALNGVAWMDDAQIQGGGVKRYGAETRIDVTLRLIAQPDTPSDARRRKKAAQPRLRV